MITIDTLSNGIRVVCEPMNYLHSISVGVWVNVGSADESLEMNGLAHVIEHMVFKGTTTKSAKKIAEITAAIGGNLNAYTSKEYTFYYAQTLAEHVGEATSLLGDMLCNPLLNEHDLEKEKGVILEEIDMYEDSPEDMVHEMLQMKIWKDHPLGHLISGSKETVRSFSMQQIKDFMNLYYVGSNMVISVAGNIHKEELLKMLEHSFNKLPGLSGAREIAMPVYRKAFYQKQRDIEQVHLDLAFDTITAIDPKRYVFYIVNSILGSSVNSRLFQQIREDKGLTYTIYSYGSLFEHAGLFQIYAAMNPKQLPIVYDAIRNILEQIQKNGITSKELANTKEEIKTELILNSESTHNRMESNAKSLISMKRITYIEETIENINKVTLEDTDAFLNAYLEMNQMSYSVVGPIDELPF